MKRRLSPFVLLCVMGGLAILSSTMSKNPALPLFIRSLNVPRGDGGLYRGGLHRGRASWSACRRGSSRTLLAVARCC